MNENGLILKDKIINRISGPVSMYYLTPSLRELHNYKEENIDLPLIILFGDHHYSRENMCPNCDCDEKSCCYEIYHTDFLKELDKDRNEKKCEYAVLVSLLESDNDFYNNGIVDMSHKFSKMYVIRPQFFIPIISLLRNAAMNSLQYKAELNLVKNQNIDITNFEEKMSKFKEGFAKNYDLASRKFKEAIDGIDKTIKELEKTKNVSRPEWTTTSQNHSNLKIY